MPAAIKIALIDRLSDGGLAGGRGDQLRLAEMGAADGRWRRGAWPASRGGPASPIRCWCRTCRASRRRAAAGAEEVAVFAAARRAFRSATSTARSPRAWSASRRSWRPPNRAGIKVRGYVSCVLGCPYEGAVAPAKVAEVAAAAGGDGLLRDLAGRHHRRRHAGQGRGDDRGGRAQSRSRERLAVHFHDTYGQALANILAALECGVAVVDSSVAGLGGCPYAPGAARQCRERGCALYAATASASRPASISMRLIEAGRFISDRLGRPPASKVSRARPPRPRRVAAQASYGHHAASAQALRRRRQRRGSARNGSASARRSAHWTRNRPKRADGDHSPAARSIG